MTSRALPFHLTHFIFIGQNLREVEIQGSLGVLVNTLINKLTQRVSNMNEWQITSTSTLYQ